MSNEELRRHEFPVTGDKIFLAHAGDCPLPRRVAEAIADYARESATGDTIVEALSMAGGFTRIAARNKTRIVRIENGVERIYEVNVDAITKAGKMIQAVPVKPNDLIVVPESFF